MSGISIKKLTKKFKEFVAVDDISFEVPENHVMGFLGPNGAGKTTTLRMLVGLSRPNSGEIEIAGKRITFGDASANITFGYLPEQPSFYRWMNGQEYLSFIADTYKIKNDVMAKKIKELLTLVNLYDARRKRISTYSNGMKQRLGIAQALMNDPKVLIMDEPVSALDPIGRREVLNIIQELKKEKTILLSTHILSDVDKICDDVAIINNGKILVVSPIAELKEKYGQPILEVEFDKDPKDIEQSLKAEDWVNTVERSGNYIKIWPKDIKAVDKNEAIKFLSKQNIGVLRYGQILPEIEDLFVRIIREPGSETSIKCSGISLRNDRSSTTREAK